MTTTLPDRGLRDDPNAPTPCAADPDRWDIPISDGHYEAGRVRHRVLNALRDCAGCPALTWCARKAVNDPPLHHCVQGGLIWPGTNTHRRAREEYGRPVPYQEWQPPMARGNHRQAAA